MPEPGRRPPVSVIVPFAGDREELHELLPALRGLTLADGDEIVIADNTPSRLLAEGQAPDVRVVPAAFERSSYHARNTAVLAARGEWLLFLDADCRPPADLIDRFFTRSFDEGVGVVSGGVMPSGGGLLGGYAMSRYADRQALYAAHPYKPFGITANLLVRREAFDEIGGFQEGVRSGGDVDLCWRAQAAGWKFETRPDAAVVHVERETLGETVRVAARYGAGRRWLQRTYPRSGLRPTAIGRLARCAIGAPGWLLLLQPRRGLFKLIDAAVILGELAGYYRFDNAPERLPQESPASPVAKLMTICDQLPARSETFVVGEARALGRAGAAQRLEGLRHPGTPALGEPRELRVTWLDTEGVGAKARDAFALALRHPLRCLRDLAARGRWRREEDPMPLRAIAPAARRVARGAESHIHSHFAAAPALNAMRISRLTGRPYSVMVHGFDVYREPANLAEKLRGASFVGAPCDAMARDVAALVPEAKDRLHKIVMGVDGREFTRSRPYEGGGNVLAVGRLVEKKGFATLIEAAALSSRTEGLTIVGDGPLGPQLRKQAERLDGTTRVELPGGRRPDQIRELLEDSALLVCPSVIAADGDRDSMPVVVKEALAMEVPVVASDLVGLPELVADEWGRLVPPGQAAKLAAAIDELLGLPLAEQRAMGAAGRRFVLEHCDPDQEASELLRLVADGRSP